MSHKEIQVLQPALPILTPMEFLSEKPVASGQVTLISKLNSTRWISGTNGRVVIQVENSSRTAVTWCRASLVRVLSTHGRSFDPVQKGTYGIDASRKIIGEATVVKGKDSVSALHRPTTSAWSEDVVFGIVQSNRACEYWNGVSAGHSKSVSLDVTVPPFAADIRGAFVQVSHFVQVSIGAGQEILGVVEVPVVVTRGEAMDQIGMTGKVHSIIGLSSFRIPTGRSFVQQSFTAQQSAQQSFMQVSPVSPPSPNRSSSLRKMDGSTSPMRMQSLTSDTVPIGVNLFGARSSGGLVQSTQRQVSRPVIVERISEWDAIEM